MSKETSKKPPQKTSEEISKKETKETSSSTKSDPNETNISFADLKLSKDVLKAVEEAGYESPSAIQAETIPLLLEGRDMIGQAQTGTGKTAAFSLPLLSNLDLSIKDTQILVLAPTRELAIQVAEAMQSYARHLKGFHVMPIYGGQSIDIQLRQLRRGAHVVVGTPGRVMDHLRRKTLKLGNLKAMVLDEADEMLRMGFIDDVETILKETPDTRQTVLFSATMPNAIKRITQKYLNNPADIKVKSKTATVSTITQYYWSGKTTFKLDALTRLLEAEEFGGIIIFVRTKNMTTELSEKLAARGYASVALNGDVQQSMREKVIARLKKGSIDIIVATDVVARGLDVERITHVINYDMPADTESYVHRIGRTGRAGRKGTAILFVPPNGKRMLHSIERVTGQTIEPLKLPSPQDISEARINRFKEMVVETAASQKLDFYEKIIADLEEKGDLTPRQISATLAFLVQRDRPLLVTPKAIPDSSFSDRSDRGDKRGKRERGGRDNRDRNDRSDRSSNNSNRDNRSKHSDGSRSNKRRRTETQPGMVTYRLDVGKEHGAEPRHIVGAIANEAGVESQYIQNIDISSGHSTVDLPEGMPKEIEKHLKGVRVMGQQLQLRKLTGGGKSK
ncbi:MAG: DEAD/DEAH box helicase [Cocleimonas sp.]|nr:DEAD/DEAH box helicase [Cocleimonas sp.]